MSFTGSSTSPTSPRSNLSRRLGQSDPTLSPLGSPNSAALPSYFLTSPLATVATSSTQAIVTSPVSTRPSLFRTPSETSELGGITPETRRLESLAAIGRVGVRGENPAIAQASRTYGAGRNPFTSPSQSSVLGMPQDYTQQFSQPERPSSRASDYSFNVPIADTRPLVRPQPILPSQMARRGSWIDQIGVGGDDERRGRSTTQRPLQAFQVYDSNQNAFQTMVASNRPSNYDYGTTGSYYHGPNTKYARPNPSTSSALSGAGRLGSKYREPSPPPWRPSETGLARPSTPIGARSPTPVGRLSERPKTLPFGQLPSSPPTPPKIQTQGLGGSSRISPTSPQLTPGGSTPLKRSVGFPGPPSELPGMTTIRDRYPTGTGPPRPLTFPSQDPRYRFQTKPDGRAASPGAHLLERERLQAQDRLEQERLVRAQRVSNWAQGLSSTSDLLPPSRPASPPTFTPSFTFARSASPSGFPTRPTTPQGGARSMSPIGVMRPASPIGIRSSLPGQSLYKASRPTSPFGGGRRKFSSSPQAPPTPGSSSAGTPLASRAPQPANRLPSRPVGQIPSRPVGQSQSALDARMAKDLAAQIARNKKAAELEKK